MISGINKRIVIGAGWMILLRWTDRLVRLVSIAVLARLLLPADFGLVGYAMVLFGILDLFFSFGFETVLIREQEATKHSYNTAWTLELIKGLILSILIAVSSKSAAEFFHEPDVEVILYWIAVLAALRGLENIGTVDFQKNLTLHKDFYFNFTARFLGTITTIVLALELRNYWALVYGMLVRATIRIILSYAMCEFRPRLCLSEFSRIFGFSKWLLVQNIFSGLNERLPVILIGRYFNAQALAYFNMGFELSTLASQELGAPIRRALYPGIAKMQKDHSQMANTLKVTLGIIVLIGLPATIGIAVTAPLLVPALLGKNWIDVVPIMQVLALHATTYIYYNNSHVIYYALGRPRICAYISVLRFCILAPMVLLVVPDYGALGAAWVLVATNWFMMFIDYFVLFRVTTITFSDVLSVVWRSTTAVIIMAICVTYALKNPPTPSMQEAVLLHFGYCISTGVVSYVMAVFLLWWISGKPDGSEAYVIRILKGLSSRLT